MREDDSPEERAPDTGATGADAYAAFRDGDELLASGNPHAAVVALERARALEPEQVSVRETLARAYYRAARYDAAAVEFARAVELDPVNDYAHFGLGLALRRTGDLVGARRHLRIAAAMRPENDDYRNALSEVVGDTDTTDATDAPDAPEATDLPDSPEAS